MRGGDPRSLPAGTPGIYVERVNAAEDTHTAPVVAGFDADGNWHIPGGKEGGRFARKGTGGWSSAKALALRALRGAFARDTAKAATKMGEWNRESRSWDPDTHVPVWLEAADDYLSRLGVAKGHAVKVTYLDDTYGAIDAVHPDGTTRPVKVKWDRFADHLPSRGAFGKRTLVDDLDSDLPWHERSQTEAFIKAAFEHDLGDVYTTASVSGGVLNGEGATVNVEVYRSSDRQQIGRAWYELRVGNGVEAHIQTAMVTTKGKGIGTRFTRAIEEGLAANGVSRVTLDAMTDKRDGKRTANGAYTWARAGFGWGNYDDARKIGRMMLELDPGNDVGRRLVESKIGPDLPTPNDAATDPTGRRVLLWDHDLDDPGWSGVKHLDRAWPKAAPRVETPTVRRNTTKADKGVGAATAARIKAAGGTGQVTIADGYLARHGHPKGATATVTYVDDTYADVHPATGDGRTIRSKWSHFVDDPPEAGPDGEGTPEFTHDLGDGYHSIVLSKVDRPNGSYSVTGAFAKDGKRFGEFSVGVYPGQRSLAWGWVGLPPEHQRSGVGSRFMAATEGAFYRGGIIDHAVLTADSGRSDNPADVSVGAYVMAKAGYQWRTPDAAFDVGEAMLELDPRSTLAQRLVSGDGWGKPGFPTPADVAADPVGREALMDVQWEGTKNLADAPAAATPTPTVGFDSSRPTDATILDWVHRDGLVFPESEAMELHTAKLNWLVEEGVRRGMTVEQANAARQAIDSALDQSSDTLGWASVRDRLAASVANVAAGHLDSDLDRGVALQQAFTHAVWQARYGDAPTVALSRIVSHDDAFRSMPGVPVSGVSSWVVRENEQQVIDWFNYRDLTPEVIRADIDRDRVLMLPWGEGRYRSNYVRIHGETLVTAALPEGRDPREMLLDPDASAEDIADALYTGVSPGGNRVARRSVTERVVTSGPPHDPQTRRVIRVVAALVDNDPDWVDADGNPGKDHKFSQVITIAPGVDGDPHVSIHLESGGDDLWHDVEMFTDTMADRIDADAVTSLSPGGDIRADLRQFIDDGWTFNRNVDPVVIRSVGETLANQFPANMTAQAWRDWDGNDANMLPQPQVALADPDRQFVAAVLDNLSYLGIKDRTGRRAVPELPRPGSQIEWADAKYLPDGTVVVVDVPSRTGKTSTPTQYTLYQGRFIDTAQSLRLTGTGADYQATLESLIDDYSQPPGLGPDGYPMSVKVLRYKAAPLPTLDNTPPDPTPGVVVPDGTVPAPAMFRPGMVVSYDQARMLPPGTLVRQVMENETPSGTRLPLAADGGFDWRVGNGYNLNRRLSPDQGSGDDWPSPPTSGAFMVTAVPDKPSGRPDTAPPPAEFDVRARQALVDAAGYLSVPGDPDVAPFAVGATWPTDWAAATLGNDGVFPEVKAPAKVLAAGLADYITGAFTGGAQGGEAVGPLWRVPGRGMTNHVMWADTPIEGVEPEVVPLGRLVGALGDGDGFLLFGPGITPTPWREPKPTPLDDAAVAERVAALRLPDQPDTPLDVVEADYAATPASAALAWLASPLSSTSTINGYGMVYHDHPPGPSGSGPIQAVRFARDPDRDNKRVIHTFQYPIGSPEMELAGWDPEGDDLILPIDDQRLPAAIDAAWWDNETRAGTVGRVESAFIATGEGNPIPGSIEPRISRALKSRSDKLIADATTPAGDVRVAYRDGRFVLDPEGEPVAPANVRYASGDGQVFLAHDGAVEVLGAEAVTPDYSVALDVMRPWNERVSSLAEQRRKLLAGLSADGTRLDHLFAVPTHSFETGDSPITPIDDDQMRRAQQIEEFGNALSEVVRHRMGDIERNPDLGIDPTSYRGGTWRSGGKGERPPSITPGHAKSLTKLVREVQKELGEPFDNDTGALILDKLAKGEVHVDRQEGALSIQTPRSSFDSVTIYTTSGLVERKRGPWMRFYFDGKGRVAIVDVHPDQAHQLDTQEYVIGDGSTNGKPIGRRMMKLAQDIGLVSKADPRPTLSELAFLHTLEALDVDMSTNPDLKIDGANGAGTIGRSTSPEVYAAKIGLNVYPRDWTDRLPEQRIEFGTEDFALSGGGWNQNGKLIHIADPRMNPRHRDTIVHEFGHSFEAAIPGLRAAQAWYLMHRVRGTTSEPVTPKFIGNVNGNDAYAFPADFARVYSGRVYNRTSIAGNDNYEVFTTAMEGIINRGSGRRGRDDDRLTAWVMGILSLIRPEART